MGIGNQLSSRRELSLRAANLPRDDMLTCLVGPLIRFRGPNLRVTFDILLTRIFDRRVAVKVNNITLVREVLEDLEVWILEELENICNY